MANVVKSAYGIDDDVEIVINFTDQPKSDELAAFVRKDEKIEIYLNVKEVDVSDMEQVYNALGAELNHYNPSNPYVYDKTEEQAGKGNLQEELFTSIGRKPLDGSGNNFYEDVLNGSNILNSGNEGYLSIDEGMLDFCTSNAQSCRKDYKPIGTANGSQTIGAGQTINQAVSNTLINAISKFDPKESLNLAGKLINGELSEYDYTEANKKYNSIIQREAEKLRQEAVKGLDVTNYDSPYAMGSGIIISPDNIKVNTEGALNSKLNEDKSVKRNISDINFVLTTEATKQGKNAEIFTSSISDRVNHTAPNGVLTYKDLYEAGLISKEEYDSTKMWSLGYQTAAWSEYVGPVVGGTSTYIAGKNGLLTQNNISNNKKETWTVDPEMIEDDIKAGVRTNNRYVRNTTAQKLENLISDSSNYIENKHKNGKFMYVIDKDGNIIIGTRDKKNYNRMPHPTLIGGENPEVLSAGMVEIRGGKIYKIDNASGHFKPGAGSLDISQKFFEQLPEKVFSKDFKGYEDYSIKK